uniref:F-box domain-containing protein n=1 Tax=Quercus lobata TaxID=97700 RepID=A0A7N2MXT4_QUELO
MLNKLPDSIVHHILFFLHIKDHSRLSCVSRRCRDLCISTPYVALSNTNYTITEISRRFRFNNFVDRFMSRRNWHGTKLHTFVLHWCFELPLTDEAYRVDTWLSHAVNSGVQRIQLDLSGTERFPLPQFILSCKSMSFLSVKNNNSILKLPSTSSAGRDINTTLQILVLDYLQIEDDFFGEWLSQFKSLKKLITRISRIKRISLVGCGIDTSLQTLVLDSVQIEEEDYFGEWLSHFKSLKELNLTRIRGIKSMSIHNSSIDGLAIKYCDDLVDISIFAEKLRKLHIIWHPHNKSSSVGSLKILAPNLEDFRWGGHVVDYYCIEDFSSKLNLIIALRLSDQLYESSTTYYLHKILCSMQRAKVLSLRDEFVEVLFKYGCLPYSFDNLEYLTIVRMSSFEDKIPAVSSLLRETRSLKWLFLLNDTKTIVRKFGKRFRLFSLDLETKLAPRFLNHPVLGTPGSLW